MPIHRTMADLSQRADEIAQLCRESGQPVFITDNGRRDLVVMSLDSYEQAQVRLGLYRLLDVAETDFRNGDRGVTVDALRVIHGKRSYERIL